MSESQKKIIVVTGGAGFIGSHLCERLAQDPNNRVISLDNYFTGSHENHVEGVEYREGHTKDIAKHITEKPDLIFHLGEYARVEQSVLEPEIVEDLNVKGTASVIEFWQKHKCKLVYAGSSTKFGDGGDARYTSPYAQTKADNSERVREIGEKEKLPFAITYFYNVYGPRERSGVYGTVIEHFKRMYLSGAPCAIVSPGTQTRNFTHVFDIVDGLALVGEKGEGDEFGLGNKRAYSIREVADMFGCGESQAVMFPERIGNRMNSTLSTDKIQALGWEAQQSLTEYIKNFTSSNKRGEPLEKRVLVFSTTMYPIVGVAENSFIYLARQLPTVHFDVVTVRYGKSKDISGLPENVHLHKVGIGSAVDKFLLPIMGGVEGVRLAHTHRYLFAWSLMASYAALAALAVRPINRLSLLVTLADQNLDDLSVFKRGILKMLLHRTDQVYGTHTAQEKKVQGVTDTALPRNTLGDGDSFANAIRFAYADIVRHNTTLTK